MHDDFDTAFLLFYYHKCDVLAAFHWKQSAFKYLRANDFKYELKIYDSIII